MKMIAIPLALLTLGCAPAAPPAPADPLAGPCDASRLTNLVGRPYSEALAGEAQRRSGARTTRRIRPGDAVTMDFRSDRLNIHLGSGDRVDRFDCG